MKGIAYYAGVGGCCGVLVAGVVGAVFGLFWGLNARWPPGPGSACFGVAMGMMYLGPIAAFIGGITGGAYGWGVHAGHSRSRDVHQEARPRSEERTSPDPSSGGNG